jgi:hypothetical protein
VTSKLLKEEADARRKALVAKITEPIQFCAPTSRLALSTGNQPVDAGQVQIRKR